MFKKGNIPWSKGKKFSKEYRKKISEGHKGEKNYLWKGGKHKHTKGYILVIKPEHPFCNKRGYVFEHRLVMEQKLGYYLKKGEVVHHINEIKDDNRLRNLMLFKNAVYHLWFHKKGFCNPQGIIFDGGGCRRTI